MGIPKKADEIYRSGMNTNNGKFVKQLEERIKQKSGLRFLFFCNDESMVLRTALKTRGFPMI